MKYDNQLNEILKNNADDKFAKFSLKIMNTKNKVVGVKIPILKKIAKEFTIFDDFLENVSLDNFEKIAVAGFYIAFTTKDIDTLIERVDFILPYFDNWGNCDCFVSSLKLIKKGENEFFPYVKKCLNSGNEFTVRFAIVVLLDYYLNDEQIVKDIFDMILEKQGKTYYIDMAIAWLISVAFVKFRDDALNLLKSGKLNKQVQNKSISKICDSFRVSNEDKVLVKMLRYK